MTSNAATIGIGQIATIHREVNMPKTPASNHSGSTPVIVDLPAIEGFAGRVDRLAAEVSLTRASLANRGDSAAEEAREYVDGLLHLIAVAARETAERLRDTRDSYANTTEDSAAMAADIWPVDHVLDAGSVPSRQHLVDVTAAAFDELDTGRLAADCARWATVLVEGLDALGMVWTDRASKLCARHARGVVRLTEAAAHELAILRVDPHTAHRSAAA